MMEYATAKQMPKDMPDTAQSEATSGYFREYPYANFSFLLEEEEAGFFAATAPRLGTEAPDFELHTIEGELVRLAELPYSPVVIEFGSYTCPIFTGRIEAMNQLAEEYPEATFLIVYTREAHPGEITPQPGDFETKRRNAAIMQTTDGPSRTVLVDGVHGPVHLRYGGGYNSVFVLDGRRRVVLRRLWNEPSDVRRALGDLRNRVRPIPFSSVTFASASERQPPGVEILQRGGRLALEDFYQHAPRSLRSALQNSAEDVRRVVQVLSPNLSGRKPRLPDTRVVAESVGSNPSREWKSP